jgi:hypothetical protein
MVIRRDVCTEEILKFCDSYDLVYIETSAKTKLNINQVFEEGTRQVLDKIASRDINPFNEVS